MGVAESKESSHFEGHVEKQADSFQLGKSTCLDNGTCPDVIKKAVDNIRHDYQLLGPPSSLGKEYISLDSILKLYFGGGYGLPDKFLPAYYQYELSRPGTVCWFYEFHWPLNPNSFPMENHQNCWTHNKNIVP